MKPIIRVENLSKQYRIGARRTPYLTLRESIINAARSPLNWFRRNGHSEDNTIWALKDVSFEVMPGEVVGIIGRNGAGKSTLLKILSRITEPTTGQVDLYGRVGSLLEVGTGFHPELTGRENIFLNGAVLGMNRGEIQRKFDEIVDFAEVEKFIDTPVKHYSSGMYMRLAFAVAAHLEPEILLVDEVLAVGDVMFQKKCLGKLGDVAKEGRTVLFVSHNMTAVQSFCSRAVWLQNGTIACNASTGVVVTEYLQTSARTITERNWDIFDDAPGNEMVRLCCARIQPPIDVAVDDLNIMTSFAIEIQYWNLIPEARLNLSMSVYNQEGACVFATTSVGEQMWHGKPFPAGLFRSVCHIPGGLFNDGVYRISLLIVKDAAVIAHREEDILMFELQDVAEGRGGWYGKWPGIVRPVFRWDTNLMREMSAGDQIQESEV